MSEPELLAKIDTYLAGKGGNAADLLSDARSEIASLTSDIEEVRQENTELEGQVEQLDSDLSQSVNRLLDCVERPCGTRQFNIASTGERDRALIELHDAVGRRL